MSLCCVLHFALALIRIKNPGFAKPSWSGCEMSDCELSSYGIKNFGFQYRQERAS